MRWGGFKNSEKFANLTKRGFKKFGANIPKNSFKTLFSNAKTPKIFRALRARGDLKSPKFPNSLGGVSKIFACGAICVGGVLKILAHGHIGGGGVYKEGRFNNNSVA